MTETFLTSKTKSQRLLSLSLKLLLYIPWYWRVSPAWLLHLTKSFRCKPYICTAKSEGHFQQSEKLVITILRVFRVNPSIFWAWILVFWRRKSFANEAHYDSSDYIVTNHLIHGCVMAIPRVMIIKIVIYLFGIESDIECKKLSQGSLPNLSYWRGGYQNCH